MSKQLYNGGEQFAPITDFESVVDANDGKTLANLKAQISGIDDKDITASVTWTNGKYTSYNSEISGYNQYISYNHGKAAEIDITDYDVVTFTGALYQKTYCMVGFLVDENRNLITTLKAAADTNNASGTIKLSDFSGYEKIYLRLNGAIKNTSLNIPQDVCVRVSKRGISNKETKVKKICLNGDSLCNTLGPQLMRIAHAQGYEVLNRTRGGENIIGNLTRAGGMTSRVAASFTMPASGAVNISLKSSWIFADGSSPASPYSWTSNTRVENRTYLWIKGVLGLLNKIDMVGILVYDSSKNLLETYSDGGSTVTISASAAYIRINIDAGQSSVMPHVTTGSTALDVEELCTESGWVNGSDNVVADNRYLHSDYIAVSSRSLYFDGLATSDEYTFTRNEAGEAMEVGEGTECIDNRFIQDQGLVHIWFSGQNGGYSTTNVRDDEEYAEMTNAAVRNFGENFIVVTTHTSVCTTSLARAAQKKFGTRYLNMRAYLAANGIYDALRWGLISDSSLQPSDWEAQFLDPHGVHENNICAYLEAVQMWNRLVDLGIVEGTRVDNADTFIDSTGRDLALWYFMPEMGYGANWPWSD